MNNFYVIALNEHPTIIKLKIDGNYLSSTSINNIDKIMSRFTKSETQKILFDKNKIDDINTELMIVRVKKYNGKLGIKYYPVIYKDNYNIYEHINNLGEVRIGDIKEYIVAFYNKLKKKEFKEMVEFQYSLIDEHLLNKICYIVPGLFDDKKRVKTENQFMSYSEIRKIINMLNYDAEYSNFNEYLDGVNVFNKYVAKHKDELLSICDKNIIEGQMNLFSDFPQTDYAELENNEKEIIYHEDYYINKFLQIQHSPFDDPKVKEAFEKGNFSEDLFSNMSYNDRIRCGMIDAIDYKNAEIKKETEEYKKGIKKCMK